MTREFDTLPDVLGALEDELRARAVAVAAPSRRLAWRRPMTGMAIAAACAVLLVFLPGSTGREAGTAYGEIPLLRSEPVPVPDGLRRPGALRSPGYSDAALTQAWAFEIFGGTGYLLRGREALCVSVPDGRDAPGQYGINCMSNQRFGVWIAVGSTYVVAVPEGVPAPTVEHPDGSTTTLKPNADGIATDTLERGAVMTIHGTDGSARTLAPSAGDS